MREPTRAEKLQAAEDVVRALKLEFALAGADLAAPEGGWTQTAQYMGKRRLMRMCGDDPEVYAYALPMVQKFAVVMRCGAEKRALKAPPQIVWEPWQRVGERVRHHPAIAPVLTGIYLASSEKVYAMVMHPKTLEELQILYPKSR